MSRSSRKRPLSESSSAEPTKEDSVTTTTDTFPRRNISQLYVHPLTLSCAETGCLPCSYKICCFDVALDKEFTALWPNQRPETCPRLRTPPLSSSSLLVDSSSSASIVWPCWSSGTRFLTVGDGDFSFSTALARQLKKLNSNNQKKGLQAAQLTATSYESKETLEKVYRPQHLQLHWKELQQAGAQIHFQVDATALPDHLQDIVWDVVIWNFPCTAVDAGQDGQNEAMEQNKALVRQFCTRIQAHEIHITHKTKPPYDQWGLVDVVTKSTTAADKQHDDGGVVAGGAWTYVGRIVLDRALWQPYVPRKALDQKSFSCHDACTYIFRRPSVAVVAKPSTSSWLDQSLIAVTTHRLQQIRGYWLSRMKKKLVATRKSKSPKKSRHK